MNSIGNPKRYSIRAVERAMTILMCFTQNGHELTIDHIVAEAGLPKSTTYRLLASLEVGGFVERASNEQTYRLGSAALLVGATALGQLDLRKKARSNLEQLMEQTGETVHLSILNQDTALCIDKIDSLRSVRMASYVGFRDPLHCTGVGKVLLAFLPSTEAEYLLNRVELTRYTAQTITNLKKLHEELSTVREQGYATDMEEIESGLRCIAAPIRDHRGHIIASMSISGPTTRIIDSRMSELIVNVKDSALRISHEMGYRQVSRNAR